MIEADDAEDEAALGVGQEVASRLDAGDIAPETGVELVLAGHGRKIERAVLGADARAVRGIKDRLLAVLDPDAFIVERHEGPGALLDSVEIFVGDVDQALGVGAGRRILDLVEDRLGSHAVRVVEPLARPGHQHLGFGDHAVGDPQAQVHDDRLAALLH